MILALPLYKYDRQVIDLGFDCPINKLVVSTYPNLFGIKLN